MKDTRAGRGTLGVVIAMVAVLGSATAQEPLGVGSERQLFIDDLFFDTSENVRLEVHPARKTGEHNLERDKPWESVTPNWFSVMREPDGTSATGAGYRMWYECYDVEGWPTGDDTSFCYAESDDGIHWTKPELGLFAYKGSTANNILFRMIGPEGAHSRVHGAGVFRDSKAPQEERYKAVSQGLFPGSTPPHRIAGMYSADGLRWTRYPKPICDVFADSQDSAFWDGTIGRYVLYGRVGGRGRAIGRTTSGDFSSFAPPELVLETDDNDPPDSDLYNPAALKYAHAANVYLMFPSLYQHVPDTLDIRLAVSRDGIHWTWPGRDVPFIPLGNPGEFDCGSLYMGQGLLLVGDALWQYYGGSRLKHGESELDNLVKPGNARTYSRVVTRLDGFVSVDAGDEPGHFTTPPLLFQGDSLKLNVEVRPGGSLRVGLLDENGESVADCEPVTGDHVNAEVQWTPDGAVASRAGKHTRMRFEMTNASLYAFQFVDANSRSPE